MSENEPVMDSVDVVNDMQVEENNDNELNENIQAEENSNKQQTEPPPVLSKSKSKTISLIKSIDESHLFNIKENDFITAKSYLLTTSSQSGDNLYDHLVSILTKIFSEKPTNVVDDFELISSEEKKRRFKEKLIRLENKYEKSTEILLAEIHEKLFNKAIGNTNEEEMQADEDTEGNLPNLIELAFYFEQGGIGLAKEEIIRIWLALKDLMESNPIETVRFWGKIYGTEQNYIVAECDLREDFQQEEEGAEEEEEEDQQQQQQDQQKSAGGDQQQTDAGETAEEGEEAVEEDDTPKIDFKPPPEPPKEDFRTGCNRKTYFVCNEPGKQWIKLPNVLPMQIQTARLIKKFMTGRLDAPVISYPPFPGLELNYLRAQIARISAGSQISPLNYFTFDEEEDAAEDEEGGGGHETFIKNEEYEGIQIRDLIDASLQNWVHHVQHILPQGRCRWWNPKEKNDEEGAEDEEEDEEKEEFTEQLPEVGPALLTPLSEDQDLDGMPPWTPKLSSQLMQQYAIAVMRSNVWPGAYAFGTDKKFENVYIGRGQKYLSSNYNPPQPGDVMEEFPKTNDLVEKDDPTPLEEAALRTVLDEAGAEEEDAVGDEDDEEED